MDDVGRQHENGRAHEPTKPAERSPRGRELSADRLKSLLEQTLLARDARQLTPVQVEALAQVAQRHPGHPFVADPIAIEMVEAMLSVVLGAPIDRSALGRRMSQQIATTIIEDPYGHDRLRTLWREVSEVSHGGGAST